MRQTSIATTPARLFLTLGWLRAGVEKVIEPSWWSGDDLRDFVSDQQPTMLSFVRPVGDALSGSAAPWVAAAVLCIEFAIAINLATGTSMRPALCVACALNVVFMLFGAVSPSVFYLIIQVTLLLSLPKPAIEPSRRKLVVATGLCALSAVALLPFVETMHPAHVIHDPAITLSTVALVVGVALATQLVATSTPSGSDDTQDAPPLLEKAVIVSR